jgi:hypothetical protein
MRLQNVIACRMRPRHLQHSRRRIIRVSIDPPILITELREVLNNARLFLGRPSINTPCGGYLFVANGYRRDAFANVPCVYCKGCTIGCAHILTTD